MDEEDVKEQEETQQITTTNGFAGFGTADDPNARDILDDLFKPTEDTMGEHLLNRMGWKKGQGIGPRIRRKVDARDENSEVRDFPPEDSPMLAFSQKNDMKGLGFDGEDGNLVSLPALSKPQFMGSRPDSGEDDSRPGLAFMVRPKTKVQLPKRTGIGVGSLNDTGSDDEDPYEMGPKVSYNRVMGSDKKKEKKPKPAGKNNANPLLKTKPVFISKSKQLPSVLTSLRKCHDGRLPLTGFVLADELDSFGAMSLSDDKVKPPEVPDDWQPASLAQNPTDSARSPASPTVLEAQQQTAESRRAALGEHTLPGKSVFDYLSTSARDRLVTATGSQNLPPALNERPASDVANSSSNSAHSSGLTLPFLDPTTAHTALTRLRKDKTPPYASYLPKQGRYKDFLRYSSDPQPPVQRVPPLRAPQHKFSDDGHLAELQEFTATAELFKPATGFLASRFMSAASTTQPSTSESGGGGEGTADTDGVVAPETEDLLTRPREKPKDPAEEAARMGMFGVATRSVVSWQPTRLVCKRFRVEMPVSWNED